MSLQFISNLFVLASLSICVSTHRGQVAWTLVSSGHPRDHGSPSSCFLLYPLPPKVGVAYSSALLALRLVWLDFVGQHAFVRNVSVHLPQSPLSRPCCNARWQMSMCKRKEDDELIGQDRVQEPTSGPRLYIITRHLLAHRLVVNRHVFLPGSHQGLAEERPQAIPCPRRDSHGSHGHFEGPSDVISQD